VTAELLRLILAQVCLHAAMTGTRLAAPLLALREGYSAAAVGVMLALFAVTQVFLALPAGRYADRHGLKRPLAMAVAVPPRAPRWLPHFPCFPCCAWLHC
jgi:MFS family permease